MSEGSPPAAIQQEGSSSEEQWQPDSNRNQRHSERKSRFPRACTARSSARFLDTSTATNSERKPAASPPSRRDKEDRKQCSKITTPLVEPPSPAQLPRWTLRSMWELASLLNFLHMFRPLLNISVEFSAEELETALITPNNTLDDIHIPLLKAIPPVTRMALGRGTWITVLCRKLRDWWHWVAEGDIPIVASHGAEIESYKMLEPAVRVRILKALCDIRVEQEDIRVYIDSSIKHGIQPSTFRRERIGGDSHGISFWYEDDPVIGHRLYRENRQIESKKVKGKGMPFLPIISCQWETVATNLDEFQEVSDKLFESRNRMEASLGKKLKIDIVPEVEKIQKRKERTLKKQQREALLLDSFLTAEGLSTGRSLRDRKPVTYTFDDFDRSINEAIKITKRRQASPEQYAIRKDTIPRLETSANGRANGPLHNQRNVSYDVQSPKLSEYESDEEEKPSILDRSNRRRKRPQRYSEKEFVEAISDNEGNFDSDDDIVGEAVYDEEYLRNRKQRKVSSSSEGDEEYSWDENIDDEDDVDDSLSLTEDSGESKKYTKLSNNRRHGTKLRSMEEIRVGPRRSRRSNRARINYRQYEYSDSEADSGLPAKSAASNGHSDPSNDQELYDASQASQEEDIENTPIDKPNNKELVGTAETEQIQTGTDEKTSSSGLENGGLRRTQYLDLNEVAPSMGFDDAASPFTGEQGTDGF